MSASRLNVTAANFQDYEWLALKTGCTVTTDFNAIKATDSSGRIRGMVGYCDWTQNCVRMHMAVESPIVWRSLLRPGLEYPFLQAGVGMILGVIRASNERSLNFAKAVGLDEVYRLKDGAMPGEDLVFMKLLKENCAFVSGNESRHRRAA